MPTFHFPEAARASSNSAPFHGPQTSVWDQGDEAGKLDFRQLRHLTKNALQRLICQVVSHPGLQDSAAGRQLADDLERRIHLTAGLSNVLFGQTLTPGPLQQRLTALCEGVVALLGDTDAVIDVTVMVTPGCPTALEETVLRVAHELVGNAVKHGLHALLLGSIEVRVTTAGDGIILTVADNGWGFAQDPVPGEGLSLARQLARRYGGVVSLQCQDGHTTATLNVPHGNAQTL